MGSVQLRGIAQDLCTKDDQKRKESGQTCAFYVLSQLLNAVVSVGGIVFQRGYSLPRVSDL